MIYSTHPFNVNSSLSPIKALLFKIVFPVFLIWMAFGAAFAFSQEQESEPPSDPKKIRQILLLVSDQILRIQKELDSFKNMPSTKTVDKQREDLILQLDGLNHNFESLATQLQTDDFYQDKKKEDSGWSKELEGLIMPLLEAVSEVTEKPRRIERLKKRVAALEAQLAMFEVGHNNIKNLLTMDNQALDLKNPQTKKYLATLESLKNKYNVDLVQATLEETRRSLANELESTESIWDAGTRMSKDFFRHRGLNLVILLTKLRTFIVGERSFIKFAPWTRKILVTAYSIMVLMLCVVSSLVALYFLNDWLLLSVIILFMLAIFWASRQFLPRMFQEVRLALNLGTVKENERLIWNGVPWKVDNLGLQATLVNPDLEGGQLQLPLGTLIGKLSRPVVEGEPWFPSQTGDWVILSDGTYGQVEQQTMEQVVVRLKGNTLKFYSTPEFMGSTFGKTLPGRFTRFHLHQGFVRQCRGQRAQLKSDRRCRRALRRTPRRHPAGYPVHPRPHLQREQPDHPFQPTHCHSP